MKFSSLQENLKSGLSIVSHIAGKNVNLPILNNVMIEAKEGNLKLITTDLEIGITSIIRGKVEKEGVYTVDSKIISDYIALLPNQKVDIEKKEKKLAVKCENYKTIINGQEADEFPLIPSIDREYSLEVDIADMKKALSQVIFAVSNSETRMELTGVFFSAENDELVMAATDSYRLAEKKIKIKNKTSESKKIIVPAKTLQELVRILSSIQGEEISGGNLEIFISENQILFKAGKTELISRLIEGQYPDYRQIIPVQGKTKAVVNRAELARAVKASSIFSKSGINDINLDFPEGKNKVVITSESNQTGENTAQVDARVSGEDNGIVVNYRYLLDGINNMDSEDLDLEVINGNTPCLLKPAKGNNYLYIIMPIKQ